MSATDPWRILIVGAGAVGSYLAVRLSLAGHQVCALARGKRLEQVRQGGLALELDGRVLQAPVKMLERADGLPRQDLVIICTKTFGLRPALAVLRSSDLCLDMLLLVQNGVTAAALARRFFPGHAILAARLHGFFELEESVVRHVGVEPGLSLGEPDATHGSIGTRVVDLLFRAEIGAQLSSDIVADLWRKFMLVSVVGGVGAATGLSIGAVLADRTACAMLADGLDEVALLARARGVGLDADAAAETMRFIRSFPFGATTSMQRDLEQGLRSEYDELTGAVLSMGREAGLDLPAFRRMEQAIHSRGLLG